MDTYWQHWLNSVSRKKRIWTWHGPGKGFLEELAMELWWVNTTQIHCIDVWNSQRSNKSILKKWNAPFDLIVNSFIYQKHRDGEINSQNTKQAINKALGPISSHCILVGRQKVNRNEEVPTSHFSNIFLLFCSHFVFRASSISWLKDLPVSL